MPQDSRESGVGTRESDVNAKYVPNQAANKEPSEGSRENAGGITNRPLETEQENQNRVPPRGDARGDGHA